MPLAYILRGRIARFALMLLIFQWPLALMADQDAAATKVKAALVFNFLKFTDWPEGIATSSIMVCVANADTALESAFLELKGKVANGRAIQVRRFVSAEDVPLCNVIFISDGGAKHVLNQLHQHPGGILTIGDAEDFAVDGGIIGFVERDGRMKFEVNLEASKRSGLQLSAQLLKLAIIR